MIMNVPIKKVQVVFKTHLDVGYTDFSSVVLQKYVEEYIPNSIQLAKQLNSDGKKKFIWTVGSFLIDYFLLHAKPEQKKLMEEAISKGYISWHGCATTTHTELMDRTLLDFSLSAPIRQVISNENNTLSIYDDENNTSSKCHQIIMPIYHNHKLSGLLITFFSNTDFENNLNITKIIRVFTEKHIHGINLENITEIDNSSLLFSEHYLENITTLLESHTHILKTNENYLIHKQNLSTIIKDFQDKLSASDLEVFENILSNIYTLSDYEHALLYSLGIKYGIELSKI